MNAKTKMPQPVIVSKNLTAYRLTKRHKNILERFDEMKSYMALAGKAPRLVRLSISDYADINCAVQQQSDGKRTLGELTYNGLPILSVEQSPQASLVP